MSNIFEEMQWRGLIYAYTEGVDELLRGTEKIRLYNGFDPTADSLHVGSLIPLIQLARMQRFGHTPIALAGGGTGLIGDPSGKTNERQLLSREQVVANVEAIKVQMAHFLDFEVKGNPALLLNNADWLEPMTMMAFLRDIGKHITVNYMMAKDSVKCRLEGEGGISFTEFGYMLLQAYDFYYLFDHYNCAMQAGGSDQYGNITAGQELIRRLKGQKAYGVVYPLITKSDGTKFGKTESGTVWLDTRRTSPYRFYQFWLNTDDRDVVQYLKYFTFLTEEEVANLANSLAKQPEMRKAQRELAREMTRLCHGPTALGQAEQAAQVLFGGSITGLTAEEIKDIFADVPSNTIDAGLLEGDGQPLMEMLITAGLASSKGDARRSIENGGIYLNNLAVTDPGRKCLSGDTVDGQFIILRKGKKNYHLIKINRRLPNAECGMMNAE